MFICILNCFFIYLFIRDLPVVILIYCVSFSVPGNDCFVIGFFVFQPTICVNATCSNRKKWALLRQESKFADWQRVRMQETSKEIPAGSLPRSLDIILRHDIVEQARAGDTYDQTLFWNPIESICVFFFLIFLQI